MLCLYAVERRYRRELFSLSYLIGSCLHCYRLQACKFSLTQVLYGSLLLFVGCRVYPLRQLPFSLFRLAVYFFPIILMCSYTKFSFSSVWLADKFDRCHAFNYSYVRSSRMWGNGTLYRWITFQTAWKFIKKSR